MRTEQHPDTDRDLTRTMFPLTDSGNAERLVALHGRDLRYVPEMGWLAWDGRRWRVDADGEVMRRAKRTVRSILIAAEGIDNEKDRKAAVTWALSSEGDPKLSAAVRLARYELPVIAHADELDAQPGLLNAANGTVDLRTGLMREHRREDLISQMTRTVYNPAASSREWNEVVRRACERENGDPDPELEQFVQRLAGYSATGAPREDVLAFLHGPGATGKTTVIAAIQHALGEYAMTADFETFLRHGPNAGPRNDIARLRGARLVLSVEVQEGRALAEGLVKAITGGDTITARFLYKEAFEFTPAFVLWLVANERPRVDAGDEGIWRRITQLPFTNVIPERERDRELRARLQTPEAAQAVLAWIVAGAREYYDHGLRVPERVRTYTAEYRTENDSAAAWLAEECAVSADDSRDRWETKTALLDAYRAWCYRAGERALGRNKLWEVLRKKRCEEARRAVQGKPNVHVWYGIEITANPARLRELTPDA